MKKALWRDLFREIKKTFGRFMAILGIVALGVAFYAGVTASSADMKHSADTYFDDYNMMDIRLVSSIGFDETDIDRMRAVEGVDGLSATRNTDALVQLDTSQPAVRLMSFPLGDENDADYINRLRLKEGRLPQKSGECVVKYESVKKDQIKIGDKIKLNSGTDTPITDSLVTDEYEVVGYVYTPYYLSYEKGSTSLGNGTIEYCLMLPEEDFISEYYTEVFVTVDGAKDLDTYANKYFDVVAPVVHKLEDLSAGSIERRKEEIKADITDEVNKKFEEQTGGAVLPPYMQEELNRQKNTAIQEAQEEAFQDSGDWKWYVLDRDSHYSYRDYESCADRMNSIAKVFPVFFFLVAGLVCLTTMTRMVEEQRDSIGTYKALGYRKTSIAVKYVLYAMTASLIGGSIGALVGMRAFPSVIYYSWNIMYDMPKIAFENQWILAVLSVIFLTLITTVASFAACYKELIETPALLMRPKTPPKGKKILLERMPFIWKRFNFIHKVTARNIFRYKKRFFMTVIGIAGCTALLMAGFGIKDSISVLVKKQFGEVLKYDISVTYSGDVPEEEQEKLFREIQADSNFEKATEIMSQSIKVYADEKAGKKSGETSAVLMAADSAKDFSNYVNLRSRIGHKPHQLSDDGVIISEKLANDYGLKAGDMVGIENKNGERMQVMITSVTEMYVGHYVFMTKAGYNEIFEEDFNLNMVLGILTEEGISNEDTLGTEYMDKDAVENVSFFSSSVGKFDDMIGSLGLVTVILIFSAGMLAFIVLYNLTNVNISERLREIATIKVLGFYDLETAEYVYRENIIITVIGSALGLALGVALHAFIMKVVEMDDLMFGNYIKLFSYVISFLLTMLFSILVNLVMFRKIKNIHMVESLKSVE